MKIGIDARKISDTGIGRYIENLLENLGKIDKRNEYFLFMAPEDMDKYDFPGGNFTKVMEISGKYSLSEHWSLAAKAELYKIDLFHSPHYTLPRFIKRQSIVTVHDIIHLLDSSVGLISKAYAYWMIGSSVSRAEHVLTVSEYTKERLVEKFGTPPSKIRVIPNGGGSDFTRPDDATIEKELGRLNIKRGYFLFVGSDRPHKNLYAVAKALVGLPLDSRFVVVGRVREKHKKRFRDHMDRVVFVDNVEKPAMAALYAGAEALLFPSYHEGFGLPPLEAMACHTPVVASDRSSIPEVTSDAALLVDPDDTDAMVSAMMKIRNDQRFRAEMVEKGKRRAALFSWKKTARMTLECYEAVAG